MSTLYELKGEIRYFEYASFQNVFSTSWKNESTSKFQLEYALIDTPHLGAFWLLVSIIDVRVELWWMYSTLPDQQQDADKNCNL